MPLPPAHLPWPARFTFAPPSCCGPHHESIPHGMIFACFMVSSMVGSAIAGKLLGSNGK